MKGPAAGLAESVRRAAGRTTQEIFSWHSSTHRLAWRPAGHSRGRLWGAAMCSPRQALRLGGGCAWTDPFALALHLDVHHHRRMSRHGSAGRAGPVFRIGCAIAGEMGHHVDVHLRHHLPAATLAMDLDMNSAGNTSELNWIADLARTFLVPRVLRLGGAHLHFGVHGLTVVQHHGEVDLPLAGLKWNMRFLGQRRAGAQSNKKRDGKKFREGSHGAAF